MHDGRLKKWEIALACAVGVTLVWGLVLGQTPCFGWWGAVYPELAAGDGVQETLAGDGAAGVVLRFRLLEWLERWLAALHLTP